MTTTAATTPTMAQITLATTDPVAATDNYNLLEDSFAIFLRTSRGSRPLSSATAAPTGLSPRIYGLSPRLPSALPPSASPRIVEPVTPDRQQPPGPIPYCSPYDTVELPSSDEKELAAERERIRRREWANSLPKLNPPTINPVDVVDGEAVEEIFKHLPRPAPPVIHLSAPELRQLSDDKRSDLLSLSMNPRIPIFRNPPSHTAPPLCVPERYGSRTSPLQLPVRVKEPTPLVPQRPELQLPGVSGNTMPPNFFMDRPGSRHTSPMLPMSLFPNSSLAGSGPTSSISDADSTVTQKRPPRRPEPEMGEHSPIRTVEQVCPEPSSLPMQPISGAIDPLRCPRCGQRFARRSNLFKHLRSVHEERRRFPCKMCPLTFKRKDHLIKHVRSVHAKVRKFSCDICGIGFAEKFNRDKHRRSIHETKRAFQCPCAAYFQDREKMQNCLRCKERVSTS